MAAAERASDFVNSLGVNTALDVGPSGRGYLDAATVLAQLRTLGVTHIRESLPGAVSAQQVAEADQLAAAGIKFDILIPGNGAVNLQQDMAELDAFATKHPGAIASIEGPNEVDIWPITYEGKTGIAAAEAFQKDLYTAVHADPKLAGIPVLNFTLGAVLPADAGVGNIAASADEGNVHTYAPNGIRPSWVVPAAVQGFAADVPGKPAVVTETNYYTLSNDSNWGGVNEAVQAIYGLDTALDDAKNGVAATYFYELEDGGTANDREQHFGLFRFDGSAKPFATALGRLTTLLADPGATASTFTPGTLAYSIDNLPWTAQSLVLQKSSGVYDLAIWDEQALWNPTSHTQLAASTAEITVHLGQSAALVQIYDPLVSSAPIAVYSGVDSVSLPLSGDPLILQITPVTSASQATQPTSTPSQTSTPPSSSSQTATPTPPAQTAAPAPTTTKTSTPTPSPTIKTITGNHDGGVTLSGSSTPNSKVTVTDTVSGRTTVVGTVVASSSGTWSLTSHAKISTTTVNRFGATATASGQTGTMDGSLFLASAGNDTLIWAPGTSNVFAAMSFSGRDVINGFKTAAAAGAAHDVIDLSGEGITSWTQVQSSLSGSSSAVLTLHAGKTITLVGVNPHTLTAADFRFS